MSVLLKTPPPRRTVLRGMLGGGAVAVALPFLDCFLNDHGTALASGAPLPVRFGSWFWGLGHSPGFGISNTATEIKLLLETKALEAHKKHMNYFSGFNAALDGKSNHVHYSGLIVSRTGTAPATEEDIPAPTLDVLIGDAIGAGTRFRSLDVTAAGLAKDSYSARNAGSRNTAEVSPLGLYVRVFGPGFADPNKANFKPDPNLLVQQSVLSGVDEQSKRIVAKLGSSDRARMEEYFTSIRELEQQLDLQTRKPPPNEVCKVPAAPKESPIGSEVTSVLANNRTMAKILAMAVACDQTKIFSMAFSGAVSGLRRAGQAQIHHTLSHEEPVDKSLGYQVGVSWFNCRAMEGCADFVETFAAIREGAGTVLDNTLIFAHSDTNDAKVHAIDAIPVMTFGKAGGRIKTGLHVAGNGDPITRVGLTAMQAMGVQIDTWGTLSNHASKPIADVLV